MKKTLIMTLLLLCAGTLSANAVVVQSQACPCPPCNKDKGTISVNTSAEKDLVPDIGELSILIETSDSKSMQKATVANKEISDKVYAELKKMINVSNGDYVKTANFNAAPEYKYSNSKSTLSKYKVTNNVVVKTKSIEKLGEMIDKSIALGATSVGSLTFSVSNYDTEVEGLISAASQKAYTQAQAALKPAQTNILGVSSIYVNSSGSRSRSPQRMMLSKAMDMACEEESAPEPTYTTIEAGTLKLTVSVNAVYHVKVPN